MNDVLTPIYRGNYSADDVDAVVAELLRLRKLIDIANGAFALLMTQVVAESEAHRTASRAYDLTEPE